MTDATNATPTTNELSDDEVRKLLDWCRTNAADADALTTLNDMGPTLLRPSVGKDVIASVNAILDELAKDAAPSAHIHAHMMILLATLLEHRAQRDAVDAILLRWMRHASSFGPARATPPELQKDAFVQRVADALGWRSLSLVEDKDAIARLLAWVDTWAPKQKAAAGRVVSMMRRNFPEGGELWKLVRLEFNRDKKHDHRGGGGGDHRGGGDRRDRNRDRGPKGPRGNNANGANNNAANANAEAKPADGAAPVEGAPAAVVDGIAAVADGAAAPAAEGERKKRRRRRRKRKPGEAVAAGAPGAAGEAAGDDGADGDDGDGDGGSDGGSEGGGESAAPSAAPVSAPSEGSNGGSEG